MPWGGAQSAWIRFKTLESVVIAGSVPWSFGLCSSALRLGLKCCKNTRSTCSAQRWLHRFRPPHLEMEIRRCPSPLTRAIHFPSVFSYRSKCRFHRTRLERLCIITNLGCSFSSGGRSIGLEVWICNRNHDGDARKTRPPTSPLPDRERNVSGTISAGVFYFWNHLNLILLLFMVVYFFLYQDNIDDTPEKQMFEPWWRFSHFSSEFEDHLMLEFSKILALKQNCIQKPIR